MDCFCIDTCSSSSSSSSSIKGILLAWHHLTPTILFLLSHHNNQLLHDLANSTCHILLLSKYFACWLGFSILFMPFIILLISDVEAPTPCQVSTNILSINNLEELPLTICRLNRKVSTNSHSNFFFFATKLSLSTLNFPGNWKQCPHHWLYYEAFSWRRFC